MLQLCSKNMSPLLELTLKKQILTVTQLNQQGKLVLEQHFNQQHWIEGELSNLSQASSGHIYFTLKDDRAQVRCAFFKHNNRRHQEVLKNGMHVIVQAKVSLYEPRGEYQLIINNVEPAGRGLLHAQFEALKKKLDAQGLFHPSKKKKLPTYPQKIGIIASPKSAAIKDIITTLNRRFPAIPLCIFPCDVQGKHAACQIIEAIKKAPTVGDIDVLILARGGGSMEDLWAFNDEQLALAIAASNLPVVTGIGHETDFTLADFVADHRAPTPTAAAESVTINQIDLLKQLSDCQQRLNHNLQARIRQKKTLFTQLHQRLVSTQSSMKTFWQRLDIAEHLLRKNILSHLNTQKQRFLHTSARLNAQNPQMKFNRYQIQFNHIHTSLNRAIERILQHAQQKLNRQTALLHAYSPLATLERGYTITMKNDKVISSIQTIHKNDSIKVKFKDGLIDCTVCTISGDS